MIIKQCDFWKWGFSNILDNTTRSVIAEYIVGLALDSLKDIRKEWISYDLETDNGIKIEVKCSGYIQNWKQSKPSKISFDIAKKKTWYEETNTYSTYKRRPSDVYVFCIHTENDRKKVNPLNTDQWEFIIVLTSEIDQIFGNQKSVALSVLEKKGFKRVKYEELRQNSDLI